MDDEQDRVGPAQVFVWAIAASAGALVVVLAALAVYSVRGLMAQVLVAVFIALSLDPMVRWMISRGVKRSHAVAVIFVLALALVTALVWAFAPAMVREAGELATGFPEFVNSLRDRSPGLRDLESRLGLDVDRWLDTVPSMLASQAVAVAQRVFGAVLSVLLVVVLTIYLMADLPRLRRGLVRLFPKRHRRQAAEVVTVVIDKVGSYMIGNLLISAIAGATAFIALTALGVPFALPLALLVAVMDLIPLIGATVGAVVCLVVSAATEPVWPTTVLLGLFFVVYQQVENYWIAPRVLRNTVSISSLGVLFAALVGASILGIIGALMAIPIAAAITVFLADRLRARDEAEEESELPGRVGDVRYPIVD